jgi:predicted site-specific integrase-resolvase
MKCKKVLKLLKVTRQTLTNYVNSGKIKVTKLPNGTYIYNDDDVYKLSGLPTERYYAIYSRVSTIKQKKDLENQEKLLIDFCNSNGYKIYKSYKDIGSGLNFDRKEFQEMLNDVIQFKISKIFITYKDRFSRISFNMLQKLFEQFDCEIIILNDIDDPKTIEAEIFNEIISLLHSFSMKVYSNRRKKKLMLIKEDLENEISI